jgi:hypothetical protein
MCRALPDAIVRSGYEDGAVTVATRTLVEIMRGFGISSRLQDDDCCTL